MKTYLYIKTLPFLLSIFTIIIFFIPYLTQAVEYTPLAAIPGVSDSVTVSDASLASYLNSLYLLALVVGALLAVIKIALAGTSYMMSDVITDKASAKKNIIGALTGLLILLSTFLILKTIFPGLTNLNIFSKAPVYEAPPPTLVAPDPIVEVDRCADATTRKARADCRKTGYVSGEIHETSVIEKAPIDFGETSGATIKTRRECLDRGIYSVEYCTSTFPE